MECQDVQNKYANSYAKIKKIKLTKNKIKIKKTMHSPATKCMPITQVVQGRGNKRFLSCKKFKKNSTVRYVHSFKHIFSQLLMNRMKQQAVLSPLLHVQDI